MTTRVVGRGHEVTASGTWSAADTLSISGGISNGVGGVLTLTGPSENDGVVLVQGGRAAATRHDQAGQGGQLLVEGSLTNTGTIELLAGQRVGYYQPPRALGYGGTLVNSGTIVNAGLLSVAGGGFITSQGPYASQGEAVLLNEAMFDNSGTIAIGGGLGPQGYARGGNGGQFVDAGVLVNTGSITIAGGGGGHGVSYGGAGQAGTLLVSGSLANGGSIVLEPGAIQHEPYGDRTPGGVLLVTGTMTNTGTVLAEAVGKVSVYYGGGGSVRVSGELDNFGLIDLVGGGQFSDGSLDVTGTVVNAAGGVILTESGAGADRGQSGQIYVQDGGRLDNAGTILLTGGITTQGSRVYSGGMLSSTGVIEIGSGLDRANALSPTLSALGGTIVNDGTITVDGAQGAAAEAGLLQSANGGTLIDGGSIDFAPPAPGGAVGTLQIYVSSTLKLVDGGVIGAGGTITSAGTITSDGTTRIGSDMTLSGSVAVNSGTLTDLGGVSTGTSPGVFTVAAGAGLVLDGAVSGDVSVALAGRSTLDLTAASAGAFVTGSGGVTLTGGGDAVLNAADTNLIVRLAEATTLTLSRESFITAIGSGDRDIIKALASGQTLTGGGGGDFLYGGASDGDVFRDTAAGHDFDTIDGFAGSDTIDVTDIAAGAGLRLSYTQEGDHGFLTAANGSTSTTIELLGTFRAAEFQTASDGQGGVAITLTH